MVRKMAFVGCSYLAGLFFASFLNLKSDFILACAALPIGFLFYFLVSKKIQVPVCAVFFSAGLLAYGFYEATVYRPMLENAGKDCLAEGIVLEVNNYQNDKSQYVVKGRINGKDGKFVVFCQTLDCEIFDKISVCGKASAFKDTYAFPAESYYRTKGIFLEFSNPSKVSAQKRFSVLKYLIAYRDYICGKIYSVLPGEEGKALAAMLFGDKSGLENDTKTNLFRVGIGHIMSVSGAHLAIISDFFMRILGLFKINKKFKFAFLEVLIALFCVMAGLCQPVLRSAVMITIVYGAEIFKRRSDTLNSLGLASLLLLAGQPFLVRDSSFLLSFAGVLGIGVLAPALCSKIAETGVKGKLLRYAVTMLCVSVVVFPVSFLFFDEVSIISPLANFVLIPVCSAALICGFIAAISGGVGFLSFLPLVFAGLCCKFVIWASNFLADFKFSSLPLGYEFIGIGIIVSIILIVAGFFIFKDIKSTAAISVACVLGLLFSGEFYSFENKDTLFAAVVGDSDFSSLVVSKGNTAFVIDLSGGRNNAKNLQKYLCRAGIRELDFIVPLNSTQSVAAYQKRFVGFNVEGIFIRQDDFWLDGLSILNCVPQKLVSEGFEVDFDDLSVRFGSKNSVEIFYKDFSMLCMSGNNPPKNYNVGWDFVLSYDGKPAQVKNGTSFSLEKDGSGILVSYKKNGKASLRRIENAGRF